jgi:ADP-ribosylglycohydrolase
VSDSTLDRPARLPELARRMRSTLLGGALGDALGAPLEFLTLAQIRERHGARGLDRPERAYGRVGAVTDDTQMTLFTAEGLIRAFVRGKSRGIGHPPAVVHHAYRRWLHTQGDSWRRAAGALWSADHPDPDGWLVRERWLHTRRAPGTTCLAALRGNARLGEPARNDSKGCGGVMRVAPVGLLADPGTGGEPRPIDGLFRLAVECAAVTHGHPTGQLPAGVLAATIHGLVHLDLSLERALDEATRILRLHPYHQETLRALDAARNLAAAGAPSPEKLETLGGGWVAEEALAIAVYAALSHPTDLRAALLLAVNHSGDSDSTGAICGNLLGACTSLEALPLDWLGALEGRETIEQLADDLCAEVQDTRPADGEYGQEPSLEAWHRRYPGW